MRSVLIFLVGSAIAACAQGASHDGGTNSVHTALTGLTQAELQLAGGTGIQSLAKSFDENVVMFAVPVPGFAHGKTEAIGRLEKALGSPEAVLSWKPLRSGISADGKHGFTFGYTEAKVGADTKLGKYVAYWLRRDDGWHIALFKLAPRGPGPISTAALPPSEPDPSIWPARASQPIDAVRASLAARESAFSDAAQSIGLGPAFAQFGSGDAVNIGGDPEFTIGNKAIGDLHGSGPSPLNWAADGGVMVAGSGDLGVTWGMLHRNGETPPGRLREIPFFTIWRKASPDSPWLYVAE